MKLNDHFEENTLRDYLADLLPQHENESVGEHLNGCDLCQSKVEKIINSTFFSHQTSPAKTRLAATNQNETRPNLGIRFLVIDTIAHGGMGIVYRGFDREFQRVVAIKVSKKSGDTDLLARFHRESKILGQLQHPGIVPVHQIGRLPDGRFFIVMKLVEGQTLQEFLHSKESESKPTLTKLLEIFGSICQTMAYAHSCGFIHRDLKPDNVMVGKFGEVQIMDWGLAKKLSATDSIDEKRPIELKLDSPFPSVGQTSCIGQTQIGDVFGTPAYMPPEQAQGQPTDKQSDVFCLGGILLEMLTGKAPFTKRHNAANIATELEKVQKQIDSLSIEQELKDLLKSCLATEPAERPDDASKVSELFSRYLSNREQQFEKTRLEKVRATEQLIAQKKRNRIVIGFSTIVVATLLFSAIAGYMYLTEKNTRTTNEARAEQERIQQKVRDESAIRSSLAGARVYASRAQLRPAIEQHTEWTLAQKEIEKAAPLFNTSIDSDLKTDFQILEDQIELNRLSSLRIRDQHQLEKQVADDLFELAERTHYPEDMQLCKPENLLEEYEKQFERLGIVPCVISHDAIERLNKSSFRTEFMYGLMLWQREINLIFADPVDPATGKRLSNTYSWLFKLMDHVDPDPFRAKIRDLVGTGRVSQIAEHSEQEEAVSSLLTVHTVALGMAMFEVHRDERVGFLLRAHQRFPNDFFVNWYVANFAGGWSNVKEIVLACYSLRPENPAVLAKLGIAYMEEGQYDRSIKTLETLVKIAPWFHSGQFELARAYHFRGDFEEARKQYAVSDQLLDSGVRSAFESRIKYLRKCNQFEQARDFEKHLVDFTGPETVEPFIEAAVIPLTQEDLDRQDNLQTSIKTNVNKLREDPENKILKEKLVNDYSDWCTLLTLKGRTLIRDQAIKEAFKDLNEIAELSPNNASIHETLAKLCFRFSHTQLAIESMKKAIEIDEVNASYHTILESYYRQLYTKQHRDRNHALKKATASDAINTLSRYSENAASNFSTPHANLLRFSEYVKNYDTAIVAAERAIKSDPKNQTFRTRLAESYFAKGRRLKISGQTESANEIFDQAIKASLKWERSSPKSVIAKSQLSIAYKLRGKFDEAMKFQKKALELQPKNFLARQYYMELALQYADQLHQQNEIDTAIKKLKQTYHFIRKINYDMTIMDLFERLAALNFEKGDYKQTIFYLENFIRNFPQDKLAQERLARAYIEYDQLDKAENILTEIQSVSPHSEQLIELLVELYIKKSNPDKAASTIRSAQKVGVNSTKLNELLINLTTKT